MATLKLAADIGGSQTKGLAGERAQLIALRQPPQVADLPGAELALIRDNTYAQTMAPDAMLPIQSIQLVQDGAAYVLGLDAQNRPNKNAKALPKRQLAVFKILDLIGQVWERLCVATTTFSLDLAVLLPFSEFHADQGELIEELKGAAKSFWYRGVNLSVTIEASKVVPEGAGLVLWHMLNLKNRNLPPTKTFVVVMVGHRNLSFLLFLNGKAPTGEPSVSSGLGYSTLIRAATQGFPVINPEEDPFVLSAIIAEKPDVVFPDRPGEKYALKVEESRHYYWDQVKSFLDEKLAAVRISDLYDVIISGGGALQLRQDFDKYFAERERFCTFSWGEEIQQELNHYLPLFLKNEAEAVRLSDVYGLYKWLTIWTRTYTGGIHTYASLHS